MIYTVSKIISWINEEILLRAALILTQILVPIQYVCTNTCTNKCSNTTVLISLYCSHVVLSLEDDQYQLWYLVKIYLWSVEVHFCLADRPDPVLIISMWQCITMFMGKHHKHQKKKTPCGGISKWTMKTKGKLCANCVQGSYGEGRQI